MAGSALLVMDLQQGVVESLSEQAEPLLEAVAGAIAAARAAAIPTIWVRISFRAGFPEVSSHNRTFAQIAASRSLRDGDPQTRIHPAVAPGPEEIVVLKRRVSAFAGSDLEVVLRSLEIRSLVLCGVATSGVVLSTLRQAADLDFELTVLSDGCADRDPELHRVLLEKVFPRQAAVLSAAEWVAGLEGAACPPPGR